jgi:hypothetical protein
MAVTKEAVSKMVKIQNETPDIDYGGGKYPLAKKWNELVKRMEEAREIWNDLQKELDFAGARELESRYPVVAQKHLGKFRNVKFEWMVSMFVDYYRGAGGLDSMYIILPPEEKKKEKKNDSTKD